MSPLWNNFLQSLFRFVVVRSNHDEEIGRISFILRWQKEEEGRHKERRSFSTSPAGMLAVVH
jgi:hypothetical protein